MEFFNDLILKIKNNYFLLLICLLLIVINDAIILSDLYSLKTSGNSVQIVNEENSKPSASTFKIDIKGEVKKPGVYEVNDNMNVSDAIKLAGGAKKGATTENINLSKKLSSEMVIVVSKKSKKTSITSVKNDAKVTPNEIVGETKEDSSVESNKLISLTSATLDELMTLPGIGEQKAKSIIEFRNNNHFNSIEDVKNISGIGESLFAKIKDYITI